MHSINRDRVRQVLRAQERSQAWLARQINMNETLLHHYLSGRRKHPADLCTRIAKVLNVPERLLREDQQEAKAA